MRCESSRFRCHSTGRMFPRLGWSENWRQWVAKAVSLWPQASLAFIDPSLGGTGYLHRIASEFNLVAEMAIVEQVHHTKSHVRLLEPLPPLDIAVRRIVGCVIGEEGGQRCGRRCQQELAAVPRPARQLPCRRAAGAVTSPQEIGTNCFPRTLTETSRPVFSRLQVGGWQWLLQTSENCQAIGMLWGDPV